MDFSQYGRPTEEWVRYSTLHYKPVVSSAIPTTQNLSEVRAASNARRVKWSASQVAAQDLAGKFNYETCGAPARDGSTTIPVRCYRPIRSNSDDGERLLPAFIHIHGGGYLSGSLDTEISVCAAIAVGLQMVVIHPMYRHTDEVRFPLPYEDVQDALDWIFANAPSSSSSGVLRFDTNRVVIGGQSAGSGIAAAMVQHDHVGYARGGGERGGQARRFCGQVLTIPWLMHPEVFPHERFQDRSRTSPVQCADAAGLSQEKLRWYAGLLADADEKSSRGDNGDDGVASADGSRDMRADGASDLLNPGLARGERLGEMPRSAFIVAGGDPLRDHGLLYAKSLEEQSVPTKVYVFPGVPHTFRSCVGSPSADLFVQKLLDCITWALKGDEATPRSSGWEIVV